MYMKYKTLRFLSLLFLAVIVSVGARAAADSHNPYTAEAKRYDKMSERVRDRKNDLATYMSSYTQGRIEMGRGIYAKQIARYRHLADYA